MRVLASRRRPPSRPARTARISARIETAVSDGVPAPMSSPDGPEYAVELVVGQALLAQKASPARLVAARADPADVERITGKRAADHRKVELVVVREDYDRGGPARLSSSPRRARGAGARSALGMRSGVAKLARASATTVRQPSSFAARQRASAVSTAPYTRSRGGGATTSASTVRPPAR